MSAGITTWAQLAQQGNRAAPGSLLALALLHGDAGAGFGTRRGSGTELCSFAFLLSRVN